MKRSIFVSLASLFLALNLYAQNPTPNPSPLSEAAEVGIVSANGNSKSQSYLLKNITGYKFDVYFLKFTGDYFKNKSVDNATSATIDDEKWNLGLRLERDLNEKLGVFVAQSVESAKSAGIDRRYNSDLGARYYIVKHENYYTLSELGYRYTTEEYDPSGSKSFNLARAYLETEKKWSPVCSTKLWVEYLPNFDKPKYYNVNGEASVSGALDSTFSVKAAYLVKYDNMPTKLYKTDTLFTTSLIAKF